MEENGVAAILLQYKEGSTKAYDALTTHLADPTLKDQVLAQCLIGLKDCVSLLGRDTEHLVGVVMRIQWVNRSAEVISAYQEFVLNLVTARTMYLRACLKMIVQQFIPKIITIGESSDKLEVDAIMREAHNTAFQHLHYLLQRIVKLVPITNTVLLSVLSENFPYVTKQAYIQACYVQNLLSLVSYIPQLRTKVLELIVDKIMKLDVRSPRHVIEETQQESDEEDMDIFDMENEEEKKDDAERIPKQEKEEENGEVLPPPMTLREAESLDAVMCAMFTFIRETCFRADKLDWEATKQLYRELLLIFDRIILPTHASSHVQFIMFYICSFNALLVESFLDFLWKKVCNPNTQPIFRQASVAYMASLLARAKYIPISTVKACIDLMSAWSHCYIQKTADTFTSADISHHGPFYSVCQALFYIFAFRHKQILALPNGYKYCQSLNLQTIVTSRLNPLKACLPVVARIFSTTARHHQLCYCDSILEKNRRQTLPEASSNRLGNTLTHLNPLDSFFPFDPYLLVRSHRFIGPMYQEFEGAVEEESSDSENDEEFEEAAEKVVQFDFEMDQELNEKGRIMATSPTDFLMYDISPGFKNVH